ncbi:MAG: prolyl oligopeptidase family serine peptidase [Clostridia bacterium]|nr:prolyl oligopeptidase family serine peptidase [Clostridia bacterium]
MHVLDTASHHYFKNNVKKQIYKVFYEEIEKRRNIEELDEWLQYKEKIMSVFKNAFPDEFFVKPEKLNYKKVSFFEFDTFNIENVLIESITGWFVNATVYLPKEKGKYHGIVCPTGHSSKTFDNYTRSNQVLARNGYISISFDPPGMKGEHQEGNDHFTDGVLGFLSGFWTNTFFILDAIRCIDYLETRDDVIKGEYGMTGISGGGTSTIYASVLDERIKACAPVCCVSNALHHILEENYTSCPETAGFEYHKYALDSEMLLNLLAPKPLLLVGGEKDEVLDYKLAVKSMEYVKKTYSLYEKQENAQYFMDSLSGHEYSLDMICEVTAFFNRYLKKQEKRGLSFMLSDMESIEREKLLCHPVESTSFRSKNQEMFTGKKRIFTKDDVKNWIFREPLQIRKVTEEASAPKWAHTINKRIYEINETHKLPAIALKRINEKIEDVLLFFTDDNKWTHYLNEGFLSKAGGYLNRQPVKNEKQVISVDLSGFGELELEGDGYDLSGWCTQLRNISYELLYSGSSVIEFRVREIMALLEYIEKTGEFQNIYMAGKGNASIPVLIASYIYGKCKQTTLIDMPVSFETLTHFVPNRYLPDCVMYDAPNRFELYELANNIDNIRLINPRNGDFTINTESINKLFRSSTLIEYIKECASSVRRI